MTRGAPILPFRFGDPGRELFGLHVAPSGDADLHRAVVLCNPFGQEAIRSYRMLRVLGERLAHAGFHVLRFDYFATGDSDGDDAEGDFESWVGDIVRARAEASRRASGAPVSLFGLRLGGTLAALASSRTQVDRLVLWDPVVDGGAYLAEIARQHASEAAGEREVVETPPQRSEAGQILGFPLGEPLERAIAAISAESFATLRAGRLALVRSDGAHGLDALRARLAKSGPVREQSVPTRGVWVSDEAMNSAYVPTDALRAIVELFTEDR